MTRKSQWRMARTWPVRCRLRAYGEAHAKLHTTFPSGRPGVGLLTLRLRLCAPWGLLAVQGLLVLALLLGFSTPLVALLVAAVGVLMWVANTTAWGGPLQALRAWVILNAMALSLLGPGANSVDARLFGRRQIIWAPDPPSNAASPYPCRRPSRHCGRYPK
jgi:hypothetical protein